MVHRPARFGAFEFVVLASLRSSQLVKGCLPRVEGGVRKVTVIAQTEIANGCVESVGRLGSPADSNPVVRS